MATIDQRIFAAAKVKRRGERLLTKIMPLEHIDLGNFHGFLQTDKACNEVECQILPTCASARHDDALCLTSENQCLVRLHSHPRIVVGQCGNIAPVNSCVAVSEKSGLAQ